MTSGEKRDWMMVVIAALVAVFILMKRKQVAAASDPPATINIPAASSTPDYLSYNLPAFQKPDLYLPTVAPVGAQARTALPAAPDAHSHAFNGGGSNGMPTCGCNGGANTGLVSSVGALARKYSGQVANLDGKLMANLLSAFPSHTVADA